MLGNKGGYEMKVKNSITQDGLRSSSDFQKELDCLIRQTGMPLRKVAEAVDIPYRTLQSWKIGQRTPNRYTQDAIMAQIKELIK